MSESTGAVRMNISVPAELKKQMDGVPESVNWSAVSADAFRAKLLDLQARRGAKTMDEVIARMKAAAEVEANEDRNRGKGAGVEWAKNYATPKQLRRLDEKDDGKLLGGVPNTYGWAGVLYWAINGDHQGDRRAIRDFWERVLGDDGNELIEDVDFAEGFIEGALGVWRAVESKL